MTGAGHPSRDVDLAVEAVFLDWGQTLASGDWNEEIELAGVQAGLDAVGRSGLPTPARIAAYWNAWDASYPRDSEDEPDMTQLTREAFEILEAPLDDDDLERYLVASHDYWGQFQYVHEEAHAFLEMLRSLGLKLAIVSNAITPKRLLDRLLGKQGLIERVDALVYSCEVGKRKPHPQIFKHALQALDANPSRSIFVGDKLYQDVEGARRAGMSTVLATWYRTDNKPHLQPPDYVASTFNEALTIIRTHRQVDGLTSQI
jgi:HAD superfamily hydrolase (TIGR01662 family)